jgi:hypothetical protein
LTDETADETISHPIKQPKDSCQVVDYRLSNDGNQVAGYKRYETTAIHYLSPVDRKISSRHFVGPNPSLHWQALIIVSSLPAKIAA